MYQTSLCLGTAEGIPQLVLLLLPLYHPECGSKSSLLDVSAIMSLNSSIGPGGLNLFHLVWVCDLYHGTQGHGGAWCTCAQ